MNLLILNPNSMALSTETIALAGRRAALPSTFVTTRPGTGPAFASIAGHADATLASSPISAAIRGTNRLTSRLEPA